MKPYSDVLNFFGKPMFTSFIFIFFVNCMYTMSFCYRYYVNIILSIEYLNIYLFGNFFSFNTVSGDGGRPQPVMILASLG